LSHNLPTSLTEEELSSSITQRELGKMGGEHTKLGEGFIRRQVAQAEADPFMWVVDLPGGESTSFVRLMHVPRLMLLERVRLPRAGEVDERHPRAGGGGFLDGRKRDPESSPRIQKALRDGEKQAAQFEKQQAKAAAEVANIKDGRYTELDERITGLELKIDTALGEILSAVSGVQGSPAASEPPAVEPLLADLMPIPITQALKCLHCDFEAKSRGGLTTHARSKHRSEDGDRN
jgi:hypothetical protein